MSVEPLAVERAPPRRRPAPSPARGPRRLFMTADAVGGVWTYAVDLARGLAAHGVRTTLAVVGPAPDATQAALARAVPGLELLPTGLPLDWTAAPSAAEAASHVLADLAAEARADLVQVNSPALACADAFAAPVVAVCHSCVATWWAVVRGGPPPEDFRRRREQTARGLAAAAAVIAPTAAFAELTARTYDLTRRPFVVRNGRTPPREGRAPTGPGGAFVFTAGRLWDPGKNLAALDRAAERIGAPVVAAGPLSAPHGERVRFERLSTPGALPAAQVARLLAERPVFVSTALYEPFGLAVLEAAQAGCALVLSDTAGFRELWDGAALFADPRDEAEIARAVERALNDADLRASLGRAARERARRYGVRAMAAATLGVHRAVLADAAPAYLSAEKEAFA